MYGQTAARPSGALLELSDLQTAMACSVCGTVLSRERSSEGLCLGCLMELALESPSLMAEIDSPADAPTLTYKSDTLSEGQTLGGRYRIRALLGRGGMGEVWRAVDLKLRVEVALKALRAELLTDERALESLRQEVRMAREVISPNVCRVFDLVEFDGQELVSMEYIDGITLLDILKMRAPLDLSEAREIASQFLAGLEAIHEADLVHRDVKPENIMMTRSGRVVLMDFGIAKGLAEGRTGTVSGTPAYMAPEQSRGEAPTARADVFSAGVVLAEMVAPEGLGRFDLRQSIWQEVHEEPPRVPESAWAPVVRKAVARQAQQRYASAAALSRALEEVTLRVDRAEDVKPYPGLAFFSQDDAKYFFGRELEVEEMWKKLRRPHLLGLIGPSGAGKSSFLRAGLLAVTPTGWRSVVITPGTNPFSALAQALVPEISGDTEALQQLVKGNDSESIVQVVRSWRTQHDQVLLVLDQFEELFTQNPPEVQEQFSELLAKLALETGAHVLVSMRDDFLFYCSSQPALSPMFSELTPLRPPSGTALRRALVQPALKCGYRFEDDSLVDEMVEEVSQERGALPMLAFAAARLWEHRDRDQGLLTREAYEHIGGVAGALAQHAEKTLERIGQDNIPIVRELFRNLVTSQATRVARTRDELLSVFDGGRDSEGGHDPNSGGIRDRVPEQAGHAHPRDRAHESVGGHVTSTCPPPAASVLDTLIDARLLTSYEVPAEDDSEPQQRIEIIHESLLSNWPRLVRWRAQDEEGSLLRDQLRQAAQMWKERGHPDDLLWTGTSFNEYELWRERYSGGLTSAEESFAAAMKSHAERRQRRRRLFVAAVITLLAIGLGIVSTFWRQSEAARQQALVAEQEARTQASRAEANQLLALGRLEIETNTTGALAYALASLERADSPVTRLFALEALWRGPTARILESAISGGWGASSVDFSPDGKWFAIGQHGEDRGQIKLWSRTGGAPRLLEAKEDHMFARFGADSNHLISLSVPSQEVQVWSIPDGNLIRQLATEGPVDFRLAGDPQRIFTFTQQGPRTRVEAWPLGEGGPELLRDLDSDLSVYSKWHSPWMLSIDAAGSRIVYVSYPEMQEIQLVTLEEPADTAPRLVGRHPNRLTRTSFHPDGDHLATAGMDGQVWIWDLEDHSGSPQRVLHHPLGMVQNLRFDAAGSKLAAASRSGHTALWDLEDPSETDPLLLRVDGARGMVMFETAFDPAGRWLATASYDSIALWPIDRRYPRQLIGNEMDVRDVAFLPGGQWIASVGRDSTLRLLPLTAAAGDSSRVFAVGGGRMLTKLAVDPSGERFLIGGENGEVWLVPVDGQPNQVFESLGNTILSVALGTDLAAAATPGEIRIWDLETGEILSLEGGAFQMIITPDRRLIAAGLNSIKIWDPSDGSFETFSEGEGSLDLSSDGRLLLAGGHGENGESVLFDLVSGTSSQLDSHGPSGAPEFVGPSGEIAATWPDKGGFLQIGAVSSGPIHLLVSQEASAAESYIVSPDGEWIATWGGGSTISLWPVPDVSQPALHTLPYEELLAKLRALTNLRVVPNPESDTGWGWGLDPFPGWEEVPTW